MARTKSPETKSRRTKRPNQEVEMPEELAINVLDRPGFVQDPPSGCQSIRTYDDHSEVDVTVCHYQCDDNPSCYAYNRHMRAATQRREQDEFNSPDAIKERQKAEEEAERIRNARRARKGAK